jgi:hypothetical protein
MLPTPNSEDPKKTDSSVFICGWLLRQGPAVPINPHNPATDDIQNDRKPAAAREIARVPEQRRRAAVQQFSF